MNRNGSTAARLVLVAAMIGLLTSAAAFSAASCPIALALMALDVLQHHDGVVDQHADAERRPPSVIRFSDSPPSAMMTKVIMIEIGIALPMISVPRTLPRKQYTTSIASTAPAERRERALLSDWRT
jgi:hypothetical protein